MNHTKSVSRFMETKGKHASLKPSPLVGEGGGGAVGRGKHEKKGKRVSYKAVLNTCLSFSNGRKNPYDCYVINRNCL